MRVKALKEYTDKFISIYEGDIRTVTDEILAEELIEAGILEEMTEEEEEEEEETTPTVETPTDPETPNSGETDPPAENPVG